MIVKTLHVLRTSVLYWHKRLTDYPRVMVFKPCKIEPGIQLLLGGNINYVNIAICVDDLLIAVKGPKNHSMQNSLKLKETGPISCNLGRDDDSSPHFDPRNNI